MAWNKDYICRLSLHTGMTMWPLSGQTYACIYAIYNFWELLFKGEGESCTLSSFLLASADILTGHQQPTWTMSDLGKESYTPRGDRIKAA